MLPNKGPGAAALRSMLPNKGLKTAALGSVLLNIGMIVPIKRYVTTSYLIGVFLYSIAYHRGYFVLSMLVLMRMVEGLSTLTFILA